MGAGNAAQFLSNRPAAGRKVKTPFTISLVVRYATRMVIFAAAALAATLVPQARAPISPERQAQATVTILTSASLRFSEIEKNHPSQLRKARIRTADGSVETVRLIEFE